MISQMAESKETIKYVLGIDEAGRGPLAGPVAVGIVKLQVTSYKLKARNGWFRGLKDSKKLSERAREEWFAKIRKAEKDGWLQFAVAFGSARMIDKKGIVFVIKNALNKAFLKVSAKGGETLVLLDGGLSAPKEFIFQKTIIKGDEKESVIALASIVAKVSRDKLMKKTGRKYPKYDFEKHKGYGTLEHYQKIKKHGIAPIHRKSFLRQILRG